VKLIAFAESGASAEMAIIDEAMHDDGESGRLRVESRRRKGNRIARCRSSDA
jgi:hypothetical protein